MKLSIALACLTLACAVLAAPAEANWFSDQKSNTMYNIGSIRNPTPQELRAHYAKLAAERQARSERKN